MNGHIADGWATVAQLWLLPHRDGSRVPHLRPERSRTDHFVLVTALSSTISRLQRKAHRLTVGAQCVVPSRASSHPHHCSIGRLLPAAICWCRAAELSPDTTRPIRASNGTYEPPQKMDQGERNGHFHTGPNRALWARVT